MSPNVLVTTTLALALFSAASQETTSILRASPDGVACSITLSGDKSAAGFPPLPGASGVPLYTLCEAAQQRRGAAARCVRFTDRTMDRCSQVGRTLVQGILFESLQEVAHRASAGQTPLLAVRYKTDLRPHVSGTGTTPALHEELPATLVALKATRDPREPPLCGAFLVGQRALLTAAHCVKDAGAVAAVAQCGVAAGAASVVPLDCRWPKIYPSRAECSLEKGGPECARDIAACTPPSGCRFNATRGFEQLGAQRATKNVAVVLTGMGFDGTIDGYVPVKAPDVVDQPADNKDPSQNLRGSLVTLRGSQPHIDRGDSGSPAFDVFDLKTRRIIGIEVYPSHLVDLSDDWAQQWLTRWQTETGNLICGLPGGSQTCR